VCLLPNPSNALGHFNAGGKLLHPFSFGYHYSKLRIHIKFYKYIKMINKTSLLSLFYSHTLRDAAVFQAKVMHTSTWVKSASKHQRFQGRIAQHMRHSLWHVKRGVDQHCNENQKNSRPRIQDTTARLLEPHISTMFQNTLNKEDYKYK
jgi:hypothetical protein